MKNKYKVILTIVGCITLLILGKIIFQFQEAPEKVSDIIKHWSIAWFKGGIIAGIITAIIFAINKYIDSEKMMSLVGMVVLGVLLPILATLFFHYNIWIILFSVTTGIVLGYFSYIIDDHLLDAWEIRHVLLPLLFGLGFGGSVITSCLLENWQDEEIYVTDHATCNELTIERYTYHPKTGKYSTAHYSWDSYKTVYFFLRGHSYAEPQEGIDYTLGTGALGYKDRAKFTYHDWAGAIPFDAFRHTPKSFKWLYLTKNNFRYDEGKWYEAEENFFGQVIQDGKPRESKEGSFSKEKQVLPTDDDVPGTFVMFYQFFKIMLTHPEFSLLRWIYLLVYLPLGLLAIFIPLFRTPFWILLLSSTIIILIIVAIARARGGEKFGGSTFSGFGGGSFGGGGAGGGW